ncbi:MAG: LPS export ABC transporter periplasmic protein LptC [Proteobacteria bacterium]|nr:LPS export ABC transporter periplasmic protein LptC [Pseudomonadota bacterium]
MHLDEIKVNDFVDNRKGWQLRGKTAVVLEDTKRMRIEQIEISIFIPYTMEEKSPTLDVLITADEGLMEWKDNRLTLIGNVVLKRSDGSLILSNSALYETQKEVFTIPGKVRILQDEHTLEGNSLTYNVPIKKMEMTEPLLIRYE